MMNVGTRLRWMIAALLLCGGCTQDMDPYPITDAGTSSDAGVATPDGAPGADAMPTPDGGMPTPDGGMDAGDGGMDAGDGGMDPTDPLDGGSAPGDALGS